MLCKGLTFFVFITASVAGRVTGRNPKCVIHVDPSHHEVLYTCRGQKLKDVPPDIPANVTAIDLSHNRIVKILPGSFTHFPVLSRLDLSANRIASLSIGAFVDLPNLRSLDLSSNYLSMDFHSFPRGVFKNLSSLRWMNLKNNTNRHPELIEHYPDESFKDLIGLEELHLDGLNMEKSNLGPGFASLKQLRTLVFSGDSGYCSIKKLGKMTFYNLRYSPLEYLDLTYCEIYKIHNLTFSYLKNIKTLDISGNMYLGLNRLGGAFQGLQNSTLERLVLNATTSPEDRTYKLRSKSVFGYLQNITTLKHLTLDTNFISDLEPNTHVYLEHLQTLSLADNTFLNALLPAHDLSNLQHLKYLNWSWVARSMPAKRQVKGGTYTFQIDLPPNLEVADFNNDKVHYPLNHLIVYDGLSLRSVNLSNNNLFEWNGPWEVVNNSLQMMRALDLSSNGCSKITETFFHNLSTIQVLHLQNNKLGYSDTVTNASLSSPFKPLVNLTFVDLSMNEIETLSSSLFDSNLKLETLLLRNNYLLSGGLNLDLKSISYLDLADNKLNSLNAKMMSVLDEVKSKEKSKNVLVSLTGNELECICETEQFFVWLQTTQVHFVDRDKYHCRLKNGSVVSIKHLSSIVGDLKVECASNLILALVSSAVALVCVTILSYALYYRFRWDIKYFFYKLRIKRKEYEEVHGNDDHQYDAFVAFSKEDYKWVYRQLRPNLEDNPPEEGQLHLCLHHRDFLPGEDIEESIIQSISKSRKTILVISRNFVRSNWCFFEMKMARMRLFDEGKDVLVLILLENIPIREMSDTLFHLIKSKNYLEWSDNQDAQDLFWKKLRMVLKRKNCVA